MTDVDLRMVHLITNFTATASFAKNSITLTDYIIVNWGWAAIAEASEFGTSIVSFLSKFQAVKQITCNVLTVNTRFINVLIRICWQWPEGLKRYCKRVITTRIPFLILAAGIVPASPNSRDIGVCKKMDHSKTFDSSMVSSLSRYTHMYTEMVFNIINFRLHRRFSPFKFPLIRPLEGAYFPVALQIQ